MTGEKNLGKLIKGMTPKLNKGDFVFATVDDISKISRNDTICEFKEAEGITLVVEKQKADALKFDYDYTAAWITLEVHSALDAVGLTALFSTALAKNNISCNVIAAYNHDHVFVAKKDAAKAMQVLTDLSKNYKKDRH